jgi:hypothetical protein
LHASHSFSSQGQSQQHGSHGGDAVIDFGGSFVQQQLQEPNQNSAYLEARDQTIESIESTIAELGQVYTRFVILYRNDLFDVFFRHTDSLPYWLNSEKCWGD